ncbi:hypothetical protein LEP1GSC171_0319 [Leptospira santarosai str. HAI1380]|uniref:Uncharacterized protein n=1 Tax=Leptospira santarosai str. ZUN179 TaxID=1049985 RepID=M6VBI7_9LEPT|nr:hypothetical protein LEP1GSC175_1171 [Leptospira santarosai str. HAI821]EMO46893.1 hypothetical protein LEP1GSC187_4171 [Leptospira santarosai str. ZUN179]EMP04296.1 hypothetical protein LEP1GSC171_0319 [Leptospira santarosai str. HAI1380]
MKLAMELGTKKEDIVNEKNLDSIRNEERFVSLFRKYSTS